ncbi:MAG: hypothetical protein H7Y08_06870 [Rhizobiaceae bacterium]|nr:hypothetical protein [Rhizobiaceae bacterium]
MAGTGGLRFWNIQGLFRGRWAGQSGSVVQARAAAEKAKEGAEESAPSQIKRRARARRLAQSSLSLELDELFELEFEFEFELEFEELLELPFELEFDELLELRFELEFEELFEFLFELELAELLEFRFELEFADLFEFLLEFEFDELLVFLFELELEELLPATRWFSSAGASAATGVMAEVRRMLLIPPVSAMFCLTEAAATCGAPVIAAIVTATIDVNFQFLVIIFSRVDRPRFTTTRQRETVIFYSGAS